MLIGVAAILLRARPAWDIDLVPAALAIGSAPGRSAVRWLAAAVGMGFLMALPLLLKVSRDGDTLVMAMDLVAIAVLAVGHHCGPRPVAA